MNTIVNYLKSVKGELKNVVWPTKKSTVNHTILVLAISVVIAVFLFELDNLFTSILNIFIR